MILIILVFTLQGQEINQIILLSLIVIAALRLVPSFNSISNALSARKVPYHH